MKKYDVVVISGSSAGVGAALAAGRMGALVALVEDTPVLGGMLANGVSNIDAFSMESLSGIFEEFRLAVKDYYQPQMQTDAIFDVPATVEIGPHVDGRSGQANDPREGGRWEPHVADRIFKRMVAETPSIDVFYNRFPTDVIKSGNRVIGVITERSAGMEAYAPKSPGEMVVFHGEVIIDATHEGDIAAWAGAPYRVGREARSRLEPHAGDIVFLNQTGEITEGRGRQDRAIVSYGLRLTVEVPLASRDESRSMQAAPPDYDQELYESSVSTLVPSMPNGKAEINHNPNGNEIQGINWEWPEATREERARLYDVYRRHALGFLHYLQSSAELKQLRLASDEFVDNDNVPYRLFVREARRIEGEKTMTEADVNPFVLSNSLLPPLRHDSIAVGHYAIDSKPVLPKTDLSTADKGPGDFFLINGSAPFQIPYGAIVPKHVDGLLVPAAMSATHVAFSAVRMDPTWTVLGQAAGVAAVVSIREGVSVRNAPVERIQHELLCQKVKLAFYWDLPADHPAFLAVQRLSVLGVARGYPDRQFRPDQNLTRAELAEMAFNAFDLWPSVSEVHFTDLPYHHWAFRYIETLFDCRALGAFGVRALWPEAGRYDAEEHAGFQNMHHDRFGKFEPEASVTWAQALGVLQALDGHREFSTSQVLADDRVVTRGEFSRVLATMTSSIPVL